MKRTLLSLIMITTFLSAGVYNAETGWNYKQTTFQCFYLFENLTIDGSPAEAEDVIGAFTDEGVCVGWIEVDPGGYTTVPTVGDDGSAYSDGYLNTGESPTFRIFDASSGSESTLATQDGVLPVVLADGSFVDALQNEVDGSFTNNELFTLYGTSNGASASGCFDGGSCSSTGSHWLTVNDGDGDGVAESITESGGSITTDDGSCLYETEE